MEEKLISVELTVNELQDIINVLGELPTKSNAWPLAMKLSGVLAINTQETLKDAE